MWAQGREGYAAKKNLIQVQTVKCCFAEKLEISIFFGILVSFDEGAVYSQIVSIFVGFCHLNGRVFDRGEQNFVRGGREAG